tara:strand:- start:1636 stop:1914 length:279 start_codon:yes stop_codon:yes gene_type:complete
MSKIENTISKITASDVQFLTETECRDIMGVLAIKHQSISDREIAILDACEDRVWEVEFGDIDTSNEDLEDGDRGWSDELHENMAFEGADEWF